MGAGYYACGSVHSRCCPLVEYMGWEDVGIVPQSCEGDGGSAQSDEDFKVASASVSTARVPGGA